MSTKAVHIEIQILASGDAKEPMSAERVALSGSLLLEDSKMRTKKGSSGEISCTGATTIDELIAAAIALAKS